jgi:N6-adenosine-specific RNA methylase IME4
MPTAGHIAPVREALPLIDLDRMSRALAEAGDAETVRAIERDLEKAEDLMRASGYEVETIRPVNELHMRARWRLGRVLMEVERASHPGKGKVASSSLTSLLRALELTKQTAQAAQRIGSLPDAELDKALADAHQRGVLNTFADLIERARPYWYQASRRRKHRLIHARAALTATPLGPFPLIYADPPWKWGHFGELDQENEKGKGRTPDQHYPTLTYDEIKQFRVGRKLIKEIAHKDAVLFLWCTSANLVHALDVMAAWGFTYKTNAVWTKDRGGTGLVFRNWHEILLYGTRGAMPGPQYQPPSVFNFPRAEHSAKPPEIRSVIERMYPDFDSATRLARETVPGWSTHGFEAERDAAE